VGKINEELKISQVHSSALAKKFETEWYKLLKLS
jgi:hypothetical protein